MKSHLCSLVLHRQGQFYSLPEVLPAFSHYIVTTSQQKIFPEHNIYWYSFLMQFLLWSLTSPNLAVILSFICGASSMLTCCFQATVGQRIFSYLCLHLCCWYRLKELPAFPWLVILYCLNYLLSSCSHLVMRTSLILVSMSLWHSSTISVNFSFSMKKKSYSKLLWLPSTWISRIFHHFFGWWHCKTWSLTLSCFHDPFSRI